MSTTYLIGAGVNRGVVGPDRRVPPLTRDLLRFAFQNRKFSEPHIRARLQPLFRFIEQLWHVRPEDLSTTDVDLEECFTNLELGLKEAAFRKDDAEVTRYARLEYQLSALLAESLSVIDHWLFYSESFRSFGRQVYQEKAAVLTFNYDGLLETALYDASPAQAGATGQLWVHEPERGIHIEDKAYSPRTWNRLRAYRVRFDEVAAPEPGSRQFIPADKYYSGANLEGPEPPPFLKLHGSLDWYYRTGASLTGTAIERATTDGPLHPSIYLRGLHSSDFPELDYENREVFLPLIITPVLNKPYDGHQVFRQVWAQALDVLKDTTRLVVVGYSFPPTDFHIRRLLRMAFADHRLIELVVVNPDTSVIHTARMLCDFHAPVLACQNIEEYVSLGGVYPAP